jgi:hypothetical protein
MTSRRTSRTERAMCEAKETRGRVVEFAIGSGAFASVWRISQESVTKKPRDLGLECMCHAVRELWFLERHRHAALPTFVSGDRATLVNTTSYAGVTLVRWLRATPRRVVLRWLPHVAYQVLTALRYAERYEMVHGDLSPVNVLIDARTMRVTVIDWGAASCPGAPLERQAAGCTRGYEPPEVRAGGVCCAVCAGSADTVRFACDRACAAGAHDTKEAAPLLFVHHHHHRHEETAPAMMSRGMDVYALGQIVARLLGREAAAILYRAGAAAAADSLAVGVDAVGVDAVGVDAVGVDAVDAAAAPPLAASALAFAAIWRAMLEPTPALRPSATALLALPFWCAPPDPADPDMASANKNKSAGECGGDAAPPASDATVAAHDAAECGAARQSAADDAEQRAGELERQHHALQLARRSVQRGRVLYEPLVTAPFSGVVVVASSSTGGAAAAAAAAAALLGAGALQSPPVTYGDRVRAAERISRLLTELALGDSYAYAMWLCDSWCDRAPHIAAPNAHTYRFTAAAAVLWTAAYGSGRFFLGPIARVVGLDRLELLAHLRRLVTGTDSFSVARHRIELLAHTKAPAP